jgi:hypothetical protein
MMFASSVTVRSGVHRPPEGGILVISIAIFIVLGSVLEGIPAIVLCGPLPFPIAMTAGISGVHFAIVAVLATGSAFSPRRLVPDIGVDPTLVPPGAI